MVLIESLSTSSDTAPTNCEVIIEGGGVVRAVGKKFLQQLNFLFLKFFSSPKICSLYEEWRE